MSYLELTRLGSHSPHPHASTVAAIHASPSSDRSSAPVAPTTDSSYMHIYAHTHKLSEVTGAHQDGRLPHRQPTIITTSGGLGLTSPIPRRSRPQSALTPCCTAAQHHSPAWWGSSRGSSRGSHVSLEKRGIIMNHATSGDVRVINLSGDSSRVRRHSRLFISTSPATRHHTSGPPPYLPPPYLGSFA